MSEFVIGAVVTVEGYEDEGPGLLISKEGERLFVVWGGYGNHVWQHFATVVGHHIDICAPIDTPTG